jgi:hypothetical protein
MIGLVGTKGQVVQRGRQEKEMMPVLAAVRGLSTGSDPYQARATYVALRRRPCL